MGMAGWMLREQIFSEQVTTLYRNYGNGAFEDASIKAGLGCEPGKVPRFRRRLLRFRQTTVGKISSRERSRVLFKLPAKKITLSRTKNRRSVSQPRNGRFEDVFPGKAGSSPAPDGEPRPAAVLSGDVDNDGDVDVIVNNSGRLPTLAAQLMVKSKITGTMIKCEGTRSNRSQSDSRESDAAASTASR